MNQISRLNLAKLLACFTLLFSLLGCGLKGPLYQTEIPTEQPETSTPTESAVKSNSQ